MSGAKLIVGFVFMVRILVFKVNNIKYILRHLRLCGTICTFILLFDTRYINIYIFSLLLVRVLTNLIFLQGIIFNRFNKFKEEKSSFKELDELFDSRI